MSAQPTLPGFTDSVDDAQRVFRAVLDALSRPGTLVGLTALPPPLPGSGNIAGFSQGMTALALALCDADTPLWLDAGADTPEVRHHLRFHCAAPLTPEPAEASFAFIARPKDMPRFHKFNMGMATFPDRSATLLISADLAEFGRPAYELSGPGVKGNDQDRWLPFHVSGLPAWFWSEWEENRLGYPLGVDILFVDGAPIDPGVPSVRIMGLPRTAAVRRKKEQSACM